jgi:hypothetical protein
MRTVEGGPFSASNRREAKIAFLEIDRWQIFGSMIKIACFASGRRVKFMYMFVM